MPQHFSFLDTFSIGLCLHRRKENFLLYYEGYAVTLPVCTVAIGGKATHMCCGKVLGVIRAPTINFQKIISLFLKFALLLRSRVYHTTHCNNVWTLTYRELWIAGHVMRKGKKKSPKNSWSPSGPRRGLELQLYSFFNLSVSWRFVVKAEHSPLYPRERDAVPILQKVSGSVWTGNEKNAVTGVQSPVRPTLKWSYTLV